MSCIYAHVSGRYAGSVCGQSCTRGSFFCRQHTQIQCGLLIQKIQSLCFYPTHYLESKTYSELLELHRMVLEAIGHLNTLIN